MYLLSLRQFHICDTDHVTARNDSVTCQNTVRISHIRSPPGGDVGKITVSRRGRQCNTWCNKRLTSDVPFPCLLGQDHYNPKRKSQDTKTRRDAPTAIPREHVRSVQEEYGAYTETETRRRSLRTPALLDRRTNGRALLRPAKIIRTDRRAGPETQELISLLLSTPIEKFRRNRHIFVFIHSGRQAKTRGSGGFAYVGDICGWNLEINARKRCLDVCTGRTNGIRGKRNLI